MRFTYVIDSQSYFAIVGMVGYTCVYAVLRYDPLTPCYGKVVYWVWTVLPVPILALCMAAIGYRNYKV
jgi:hypothetical protein